MRWWKPGGASMPPSLPFPLSLVGVYTLLAPILVLYYPIIVLDPLCTFAPRPFSFCFLPQLYLSLCVCVFVGMGLAEARGGGGAALSAPLPSPPASAPFPFCESVFVFFQYLNHILLVPLLAHPSYFQLFFTNIKSPYICTHLRRKNNYLRYARATHFPGLAGLAATPVPAPATPAPATPPPAPSTGPAIIGFCTGMPPAAAAAALASSATMADCTHTQKERETHTQQGTHTNMVTWACQGWAHVM
jgi:hypothetical protein